MFFDFFPRSLNIRPKLPVKNTTVNAIIFSNNITMTYAALPGASATERQRIASVTVNGTTYPSAIIISPLITDFNQMTVTATQGTPTDPIVNEIAFGNLTAVARTVTGSETILSGTMNGTAGLNGRVHIFVPTGLGAPRLLTGVLSRSFFPANNTLILTLRAYTSPRVWSVEWSSGRVSTISQGLFNNALTGIGLMAVALPAMLVILVLMFGQSLENVQEMVIFLIVATVSAAIISIFISGLF
jgi:hypothetical protein